MINLKPDLYALVKALVGAETLVFADQNAPRPALPYWTIRVQVRRVVGGDYYSQGVTDDGDQQIDGVREATVQLQRIGADSDYKVAELRDNISKTTVLEQWQLKGLALYNTGDVQNIPFPLDKSQLEPRAALDLFIRFGSKILDRVGVIESVDIGAGYETVNSTPGFDANADLAQNITIVL
jgi:hypothetical protein